MEDRDNRLARGGDDRREFLRKLALGTAYAVPVMATFSLDSVRSRAHAQGAYGDPRVVQAYQAEDWWRVIVEFDQPMDTSIGGAAPDARVAVNGCVDRTEDFTNWDVGDSFTWEWISPTQQRLTTSGWGGGQVTITYNTQDNSCTDFRGKNGRPLVPWSGVVDMPD